MDKNLQEKIARLKELAEKAMPGPWELDETPTDIGTFYEIYSAEWMVADCEKDGASAAFIAAANPAMILELIAAIEKLSSKLIEEQKRSERTENNNIALRNKLIQLEKESEWLVAELGDGLGWPPCGRVCRDCNFLCRCNHWREAARKAVSEGDNA